MAHIEVPDGERRSNRLLVAHRKSVPLSVTRRLALFTLHLALVFSVSSAIKAGPPNCRLPVLDNEVAWQRLPKSEETVTDRRLPVWTRALAGPLPRTTASMLELDHLYRTSDAFDPRLRAIMRWAAARANRCSYSQRYAGSDLIRAGFSRDEAAQLESILPTLPAKEKAAITFAQKLTLSADGITDEEVAELIAAFGEQPVVAMVLQMAYANFQDRLLLTLNVDVEPDGPLPPLAVRFIPPAAEESIAADRPEFAASASRIQPTITSGRDWISVGFDQLRHSMEQQRERSGRVSVPKWQDFYPLLPPGMYPADKPTRVRWSLVVMGHQPKLGPAWLKCLRTFGREANQDRVFEETLFWVITRTIHCFY